MSKILSLFLLFLFPLQLFASGKLVFSGTMGSNPYSKAATKILSKAYEKLGIEISLEATPGKRAIFLANTGRTDGLTNRISSVEKKASNLIMIEQPLMKATVHGFSKDQSMKIKEWSDLKPYTVGIVRGIKMVENNTKGMKQKFLTLPSQVFLMLNEGRVDIAVLPTLIGLQTINQEKLQGIKPVGTSLMESNLYHFLHKKHQKLVPKISKVLNEMNGRGEVGVSGNIGVIETCLASHMGIYFPAISMFIALNI